MLRQINCLVIDNETGEVLGDIHKDVQFEVIQDQKDRQLLLFRKCLDRFFELSSGGRSLTMEFTSYNPNYPNEQLELPF